MANDKNQPQHKHTQGKWREVYFPAETQIWTSLPSDDNKADVSLPICTMANEAPISVNEANANAKRIVKCVNMHDELIKELQFVKRRIVFLEGFTEGKADRTPLDGINKLIKQDEQE